MENAPAAAKSNSYQYLGRKTLWIFISERSAPAFAILLASVALFFIGSQNGAINVFGREINLQTISFYGFAIFAIVFAATVLIGWLIYVNCRFLLDDDSLKIKRGVLSKEELAIPYRQIQDVTIERSITYRLWGLSRLVILTAGHEDVKNEEDESEGILPALDKNIAEELQADLLRRANVQKITEIK